jgi:DHA2 family multidrug resistance protein
MMVVGMTLIAGAMWHMTSLFPDASFSYFVWARIYQMVALPLLFIPISTAAFAELPPDQTNQASALINVARNLGGSFGVSLSNSLLAQRSQFHQLRLVEHAIPSSPTFQEATRRVTEYFVGQGASPVDAQRKAIGWLGRLVLNQSTLLAYIDVFWACAVFAMLMIPIALLIRRSDAPKRSAVHA